jgi:hypothetical protein
MVFELPVIEPTMIHRAFFAFSRSDMSNCVRRKWPRWFTPMDIS